MGSKILINATHREEVRVAIIENSKLMEYDHGGLDHVHRRGCIYKGVVSRIEPSLNAAFIDYGEGRHGFLPASEVTEQLYPKGLDRNQKHPIQSLLQKDQEIMIQVEKEEQGNKGAALSTNLSLAGCYIVLMPMTPGSGGISRQIEGEERDYLQRVLNQIDIPEQFSLIVRTASIGRTLEELLWDFNVLKSQWEAIVQFAAENDGPALLYKDGDLLSRVIRDYLKPSVEEILIDEKSVHEEVLSLVQHIRPDFLPLVKFYDPSKGVPLFAEHRIEHEIESIFNPELVLENGSTLVFDHREALTSIDINSARSTTSSDITTTAFKTNLAAATEIARQIRLRNIGGQIIVDFIHMSSSDNSRQSDQTRQVEAALKQGLNGDKARVQIGKISKLGLLEISRQRLKTALDKSQLMSCEHCHGRGSHRQPRSVALSILRLIEQEATQYRNGVGTINVHPTIAGYLFNTYRQSLCDLEKSSSLTLQLTSDAAKSAGDYELSFYFSGKDMRVPDRTIRNYVPAATTPVYITDNHKANGKLPHASMPTAASPSKISFLKRLWRFFFGPSKAKGPVRSAEQTRASQPVSRPASSGQPAHHQNRQRRAHNAPNHHSHSNSQSHSHGNSSHGNSSHSNSSHSNSSHSNSSHGNSSHGNSSHGNSSHGNSSHGQNSNRPNRAPHHAKKDRPVHAPHAKPAHPRAEGAITEAPVVVATAPVTEPVVREPRVQAPVKRRPAKKPPAPLTESNVHMPVESSISTPTVNAPSVEKKITPVVNETPVVKAEPIVVTDTSAAITTAPATPENGEAPVVKKNNNRRRYHKKPASKNTAAPERSSGSEG